VLALSADATTKADLAGFLPKAGSHFTEYALTAETGGQQAFAATALRVYQFAKSGIRPTGILSVMLRHCMSDRSPTRACAWVLPPIIAAPKCLFSLKVN